MQKRLIEASKLSEVWRDATRDCPRQRADCPSSDELAAVMRGVNLGERNGVVLDALGDCARCALAAQLAGELQVVKPAAGLPRRAPLFAFAASMLLAVGLVSLWQLRPLGPEAQLRGELPEVRPAHGSTLAKAPTQFAWPVPTQALCRIELRNAQGQMQLKIAGQRGGQSVPNPPLQLAPGTYLWSAYCAAEVLGPFVFVVQ